MANYQDKLSGFAEKLKSQAPSTPLQEVKPLALKKGTGEKSALNIWIPKDLKKRMKHAEIETDKTLTDITIAALEQYLKK